MKANALRDFTRSGARQRIVKKGDTLDMSEGEFKRLAAHGFVGKAAASKTKKKPTKKKKKS